MMRNLTVSRLLARSLPLFWLFFAVASHGGETVSVDLFNPEGTARKARQSTARFSEAMVPFGSPSVSDPFDVSCTGNVKGQGRWADSRNWVYDFAEDLPAGVRCVFTLKPDLRSVSGKPLEGKREFVFDTGGPVIVRSDPYEESKWIDENQAFVLLLDAAVDEKSILSNVYFSVEGVKEAIAPKIIKGKDREALIGASSAGWWRKNDPKLDSRIVIIMPTRSFPSDAEVILCWDKGVRTAEGVPTTETMNLAFHTRPAFSLSFHCDRMEKDGECIPILPMWIRFSAPVRWDLAKKIAVRGPGKKKWTPVPQEDEKDRFSLVQQIEFKGPFPESSGFKVELPSGLVDDAGRVPVNRDKFPLSVATGPSPPLVKFGAKFGVLESREPVLPLTVRNIEAQLKGQRLDVRMTGRTRAFRAGEEDQIIRWLRNVEQAQWERDRSARLLPGGKEINEFSIPKPGGEKAFEVMGIPLPGPGFYVVEVGSERLGDALLGGGPMYVQTSALVTNLSAHFKRGRESSLVWVTSLDKGEPEADADVAVRDSMGNVHWTGKTDKDGIARIDKSLPETSYV
ncbi:MAG: hypothetical protein FWH25_00410, partial [Syntrophorhabdaceae bacterium]|nr:hypothetical protein [Syntrophorhabdaceae bacterium]